MSTEARVTTLEQALAELHLAQARTTANIDRLSERTAANIDRLSEKTDASIARVSANIDRLSEKTDANIDRVSANIDRLSDKTTANIDRVSANIDRLSQEMRAFEEEMRVFRQETRADSKEADRRLGELSNKMGTLAEDIVAPSIPALFQRLFGVEVDGSIVRGYRPHRDDPGRRREFDVTAWGGEVFLVNETKSRLRPEDIEPFKDALPDVRGFWPEAEQRKIIGAFSSFYIDPTLVKAGERAGLYVFGLGSGLLEVLNTAGFAPREF